MENLKKPVENYTCSVENFLKNAHNSVDNFLELSTELGLVSIDLLHLGSRISPTTNFSPIAHDLSTTYPQLIHRQSTHKISKNLLPLVAHCP